MRRIVIGTQVRPVEGVCDTLHPVTLCDAIALCLLHEFDISKPAALFFGTERDGLSEEVMQMADGFLKIPMVGYTESLNISVSAAIIIQDITNRLRQSDINWKLTEDEVLEKRLDWTRKTIKDIEFIERKYLENQD